MKTKLADIMGVAKDQVSITNIREGSVILDVTSKDSDEGKGVKLLSGKGLDSLGEKLGHKVLGYETSECSMGESRGVDGKFFEGRFSATKPTKQCEIKPDEDVAPTGSEDQVL